MDWHEEALRLYGTLDNDGNVMGYKRVAKAVNQSDKTVESYIRRNKQTNNIQPIQKEIDVQSELIKDLQKQSSRSFLCDKYKLRDRILDAYIEEIKDKGYQVLEDNGIVKICKDIIPTDNKYDEDWNGDKIIRFGSVSDTHLCNKWQQLTFLNHLYDIYEHEGITTVYHGGDISDGYYKSRPGHIYELMDGMAGSDAQAEYIIKKYPRRKGVTTKFITGNHDTTHIMNGGANIGKAIGREREDMIYLGSDNAVINITPNCKVEVNHPGDGASYAISYSIQKYMDSMTGGDKPNILLNAHHHKGLYITYRNIHAFETGTTEAQTPFMRSKRIAANIGGWIIEVYVDKEGTITRCKGEFIPLYKPLERDF